MALGVKHHVDPIALSTAEYQDRISGIREGAQPCVDGGAEGTYSALAARNLEELAKAIKAAESDVDIKMVEQYEIRCMQRARSIGNPTEEVEVVLPGGAKRISHEDAKALWASAPGAFAWATADKAARVQRVVLASDTYYSLWNYGLTVDGEKVAFSSTATEIIDDFGNKRYATEGIDYAEAGFVQVDGVWLPPHFLTPDGEDQRRLSAAELTALSALYRASGKPGHVPFIPSSLNLAPGEADPAPTRAEARSAHVKAIREQRRAREAELRRGTAPEAAASSAARKPKDTATAVVDDAAAPAAAPAPAIAEDSVAAAHVADTAAPIDAAPAPTPADEAAAATPASNDGILGALQSLASRFGWN